MFPRSIFPKLRDFLFQEEFGILYGTRQVGKTSLMLMLKQHLEEQGMQTYFFDMEDQNYLYDFDLNPKNILSYIDFKENEKIYIFIDEIQYLSNPSNFLKYLYDHHRKNIKIICSGSASLEIKSKIQDSLVGRHISFQIQPLSFSEFLCFKQHPAQNWNFKKLTEKQQETLKSLLDEFLLYGGMPAVVLKSSYEQKKELLKSYVQSYIQKDIRAITTITDLGKYNFLMKMLAFQSGGLLNVNNLAENLSLSHPTVQRYIDILSYTHIIHTISPYLQSVYKQIRKMKKLYFYDTGIRNALVNNFEDISLRKDSGALFENMVFNELLFFTNEIYFYRTKTDAEIDFILDLKDLYLLEVKYKAAKSISIPKIFYHFGETAKKQKKYIITPFSKEKEKDVEVLSSFLVSELFS